MASIVEEYESEFRPFYDVAEAGKSAVWEFSQMFGEEDSDSDSGEESDDGTMAKSPNVSIMPPVAVHVLHRWRFFRCYLVFHAPY
jgi:hypothetical protein